MYVCGPAHAPTPPSPPPPTHTHTPRAPPVAAFCVSACCRYGGPPCRAPWVPPLPASPHCHQWLEVTLRGSGLTFVVDPSYDDAAADVEGMPLSAPGAPLPVPAAAPSPGRVTVPLSLAYSALAQGCLYPNGRPLPFCCPADV